MTARQRKPNETFKKYRQNLKKEQAEEKSTVWAIWGFSIPDKQGTKVSEIPKRVRRAVTRRQKLIKRAMRRDANLPS